jgi:hypothetical protein
LKKILQLLCVSEAEEKPADAETNELVSTITNHRGILGSREEHEASKYWSNYPSNFCITEATIESSL